MPADIPAQPAEFLDWLRKQMAAEGFAPHAHGLQPDGPLTIAWIGADRNRVAAHWTPSVHPGVAASHRVLRDPLYGVLWSDQAPVDTLLAVEAALARVVAAHDPVFLRVGPGPDAEVPFTPEGLGDLLQRQMKPGVTRVGRWRLHAIEQAGPRALRLGFGSDAGAPERSVLLVANTDAMRLRRADLVFRVEQGLRDAEPRGPDAGNPPQPHRSADTRAIERLVGFAVGRALARDPWLVISGAPDPTQAATPHEDRAAVPTCEPVPDGVDPLHARVRHEAFIRRWNAPWRWRRFLYPQSRCIVNLFRLGPEDTLVVHESLECIENEPPWLPADSAFWHTRRGTRLGEFWQRARLAVTDLREADVVRGRSMDRLEAALEESAGSRSVVVVSGCLPNVIGDNPIPAMRRLAGRTRCRFYWVGNTNDFERYTANLIRDRLMEAAPPSLPRDPLGFAIVGGGSARENRDLLDLAARVGLHPMGVVLPDVSRGVFEQVRSARVFAWANQSALRDISELAFDGLPVVLLRPPAPVGLTATYEWLRAAASEAVPAAEVRARLDAIADDGQVRARLDALRGRTGRLRLAFVVDPEEAAILLDTRALYAFSILDVVLEMGFCVRFIAFGGENDYREVLRDLEGRGVSDRVDLRSFSNPDELARALADPEVGAVFSNITADPRVTAASRLVFSEADFEMGVEGFFRTAERLIRRCVHRPLGVVERLWEGVG